MIIKAESGFLRKKGHCQLVIEGKNYNFEVNNTLLIDNCEKQKIDCLKINNSEFEGKASLVTVTMMGNKELKSVKINSDSMDKDDIEALEDMILVAINDAMNQINKVTEEKMGAYTKGLPGLF